MDKILDEVNSAPLHMARLNLTYWLSGTARTIWRIATRTLRSKLLVAFLSVSILPLGLIAYVDYKTTRSALTSAAYQSLFAAASQTAIRLDVFISTNSNIISTEAQIPSLAEYLSLSDHERDNRTGEIG